MTRRPTRNLHPSPWPHWNLVMMVQLGWNQERRARFNWFLSDFAEAMRRKGPLRHLGEHPRIKAAKKAGAVFR